MDLDYKALDPESQVEFTELACWPIGHRKVFAKPELQLLIKSKEGCYGKWLSQQLVLYKNRNWMHISWNIQ